MKGRRSQALVARREELRAEIARRRRSAGGEQKRRPWRWVPLLLLLLLRCRELPPQAPPEAPPQAAAPAGPAASPPAPVPPAARVARRDRPDYANVAPEPLPWLASFRLQVAARSPRLAECFVGASRPGALKWTAAVEPSRGRVSDQTLEPTLSSDALTSTQRDCVLDALSEPPYRLEAGEARSTPSRVALVIEF